MSTENTVQEPQGALYASLARTNKQVRQERGDALVEDLKISYERKSQDIEIAIGRLKRQQKAMFDFSGTSTTSLVVKDINPQEIMDEDLKIELEIHNLNVRLEHANRRLEHLFVNSKGE